MISNKFITIFITAPSKKEAKCIISELIKKRLIACGNVLGGVSSTFIWKERVERAKEVLLIMKTKKSLFERVAVEIEKLHSYDVPEIIAIPIIGGNKKYLEWIDENVK